MSNSFRSHGLQHARPPCPSPTPDAWSNSCPSSWWCHPTISSSVIPFSSHLQSFPASGSFPMSHFFASGGQSIGVSASASVLPVRTPPSNEDWCWSWNSNTLATWKENFKISTWVKLSIGQRILATETKNKCFESFLTQTLQVLSRFYTFENFNNQEKEVKNSD